MISKGYVAIFAKPLDKELVGLIVTSWLARFQKVEQLAPHAGSGAGFTLTVKETRDIMLASEALQFRVIQGNEFAWVYLTQNRLALETSGLPDMELSLPLDVLIDLPHLVEIVEDFNEKRLDQLEAEGIL